jgi:hypothetical protein
MIDESCEMLSELIAAAASSEVESVIIDDNETANEETETANASRETKTLVVINV